MHKVLIVILVAICCIQTTACSKDENKYSANSLVIHADGTVTEYIYEAFDENTYDAIQLQEMLNNELSMYNDVYGQDSILTKNFSVEEGMASITLVYQTSSDYAQFNQIPFYCNTIASALKDDYVITLDAVSVSNGEAVDASLLCENEDKNICIIGFKNDVYVDGVILYYSEGMTLVDDNHVSMDNVDTGYIVYE